MNQSINLGHIFEQERYCSYDVALRRVRVTIVTVEKQCYLF